MSEESNGEDAVPDPKFNDELRTIIEGSSGEARFREPSAREREKLAKAAREEHARTEKRLEELKKETAKQARKADKQASEQRRKAGRPGRRHRESLWGLAVLILIAAAVLAYIRLGHSPTTSAGGVNDTQVVTNGAVPPTASVAATPASPLTESGPPADPFQSTPADKWANGAVGITIPAAKAVGQYSATQVESAYQTTKQMLVAAALNEQTLLGGAPTAFADLLTPQQHTDFTSTLDRIGLKQGEPISERGFIVSFAPGTTKLIGSVIKVHGSMQARAATVKGEPVLDIDIDYLFTYAVEPPKAPADWMRIVAHFDGPVQFGNWAQASTSFTPWWDSLIFVAGERCGSPDGFIHPDYPTGPPQSIQPTGRARNPYSSSEPPRGCTRTTGT